MSLPDPPADTLKNSSTSKHAMPFGTSVEGGVRFRLFAPVLDRVEVLIGRGGEGSPEQLAMNKAADGWHELLTTNATTGSRYRFGLPDGTKVPDPASRFQPEDVHGPSEVIDPESFEWSDDTWRGRPWVEAILYELHVGTFTRQGTFEAAIEKLGHLAELGVTAIELMCLSDFAGNRNWGYDGAMLYAPDSAYGRPEAMKAFINAAHLHGIMVILDVVYNHFGPEGNYIGEYFPQIFSDRHSTPWGKSLNFDGEHSSEVRDFIIHNALYWIDEFHIDGLRIDASHAMVDDSPRHILDELHDRVEALYCGRPIHLILENEQNIESRLRRDDDGSAIGYTAQWNHDITHLLGSVFSNLGAPDKEGETAKLGKALAEGFVIAAQMKGKAQCCSVPPTAFIAFIQTHDLVGNRIFGDRVFANAPVNSIRAIACVCLLLPQIPMLFMGDEWGASTPFPFFCDYHGGLADAVRKGRCEQLSKLDPAPSEEEMRRAPDPQAESTLRSAQLNWRELEQTDHAAWFDWYKRLIQVRREAIVPLLQGLTQSCGSSQVVGPGALAIEWILKDGARLSLAANLCDHSTAEFPSTSGRVIWLEGSQNHGGVQREVHGQLGPWSIRWMINDAESSY